MKCNISTTQTGYALILMVLMLMGIGGVVLTGFTQQAKQELEVQRYQHNQRVLQEAKQALLMFAYNYPQTNTNGIGPGRLPCPDVDNDGTVDGPGTCNQVGRFPWADDRLGIQETLDASGERLWYAVSDAFDNIAGGGVINYDTTGTITLVDQSGGIIYDGFVAGIAAVIIAPGTILQRDEDADGTYEFTQLRNTGPQKIDPRNYLDTFNGFDNSAFTNGESDTNDDGFIMGPVYDSVQSTIVVNDQLIIITADEVIAMAEKAVLAAYRDAIDAYLAPTAEGGTDGIYPWLYNYVGVADLAALSSYYPANVNFITERTTNLGNVGRIPSIFAEYFTEADSQPIKSQLVSGLLSLIDPGAPDTVTLTETYCKNGCPQGTAGNKVFYHDLINDGPVLDFQTTQILTGVGFVDIDPDIVGKDGQFTATYPVPESLPFEVYFWDEDNTPTGFWTACPAGADELSDCSRDSFANPTPGVANGLKARILHLTVTLDFSGAEDFDFDYTSAPTIVVAPATGTSHATITGTYAAADIISFPGVLTATYEFDRHWHIGDDQDNLDTDDNTYASGTVDMTGFSLGPLTLGIRFYPELPGWAFDNGWHNSVMMAYANDYRPDLSAAAGDCGTNPPCLQINGLAGINNDKISILMLAGEHNWVDGDINPAVPADGTFANEVGDVFNLENSNLDSTFDIRTVEATAAPGDAQLDKILVIK